MAAKLKAPKGHHNLVNLPLKFDLNQAARRNGRILVASGTRTRNRDFWTGKMLRFDPAGVRTEAWQRQGGLVLYMHDFNIPLAKSSVYLEGGKLWAPDSLQFHRRVLPVPAEVFSSTPGTFDTGVLADLWEQEYLNSVSIHITLDTDDEKNIEETEDELFLRTSEMIEFSIVTVPGDRDAQRYQFMLDRGMNEDVAACLACYNPQRGASGTTTPRIFSFNTTEVTQVDPELELEEVEEEVEVEDDGAEVEASEESTDEEELQVDVPLSQIVNALSGSVEFINSLVSAILANPTALAQLANAAQAQAQMSAPRQVTLRVVNDTVPANGSGRQPSQPLTFKAQKLPATAKKPAQQEPASRTQRPSKLNLVR